MIIEILKPASMAMSIITIPVAPVVADGSNDVHLIQIHCPSASIPGNVALLLKDIIHRARSCPNSSGNCS